MLLLPDSGIYNLLSSRACSCLINIVLLSAAHDPLKEEGTKRIYKLYRKITDGCDGKHSGFGGSLSAISMARVFRELDIYGGNFVDFGCADGRVLHAALMSRAFSVVGYELPDNKAQKYIFDAVLSKMPPPLINHAKWIPRDIDQVFLVTFQLLFRPGTSSTSP